MQHSLETRTSTSGTRRRIFRGLAALCVPCAPLLGAWSVLAQQGPIADEIFSESLAVLEVEVPVQVLRDGSPVRGLEVDDFRLFDRGVEREIVSFEVIDLGGDEEEAQRQSAPDPASQRSLLVLVDYSFNAAQLVARAITATRRLIDEQLHPDDRVAIVALGAQGRVSILTGFTADRERLAQALDLARALVDRDRRKARDLARTLDERGPRTAQQRSEAYGAAASEAFGAGIDQLVAANELGIASVAAGVNTGDSAEILSQVGAASGGSGIEEAFAIGATLSRFSRFQASAGFAEAVGNLGSLLRGVTGQKQALLFSQGPPADTLLSGAGQGAAEGGAMVASAMERMIEQLGRAGWPVNTFGQGPRFSSSLFYLSEETGGTAFENRNRLETATAELVDRTSVTYVLRFVATDVRRDGRRHPLEVEVAVEGGARARGDVEVRHRPHYFAPRPDRELSDVERRIQAAERALEEELNVLDARVLPLAVPTDATKDRVVLVIQIGASELASLAIADRIEIETIASATREDPRDVMRQRVDLDLARLGPLPAGGLVVVGDLDLAPSDESLRVSVTSGARGSSSVIAIERPVRDRPAALPPLLFASVGQRLILREADEDGPTTVPFRVGDQDQVPRLEPDVPQGTPLGVALVAFAGLDAGSLDDLVGGLRVLGPSGETSPIGDSVALEQRVDTATSVQLLFTVDTRGLEPGAYSVEGMWPAEVARSEPSRFRIVEAAVP